MDIMKNEKFTNERRNVIDALAVQCIAAFEVPGAKCRSLEGDEGRCRIFVLSRYKYCPNSGKNKFHVFVLRSISRPE